MGGRAAERTVADESWRPASAWPLLSTDSKAWP